MAISLTPFAPDPGYEHTAGFYPKGRPQDPSPLGCVRPEARAIAQHQTQGTIAKLLQDGDPPPPSKKPPKPKNYNRENHHRIKELADRGRRKREEIDKTSRPVTSSGKYTHIHPRVNTNLEPRPLTAPPTSDPLTHLPGRILRPPTASSNTKNYLADNVRAASRHGVRQDPRHARLEELQLKRETEFSQYQRGRLPQYLVSRRQQWKKAEEERLASRPDPSIPPGHTLMSQQERRHTLNILTQHQATLTHQLQSFPLRTDTLKHKMKRAELEAKLAEIEDALKIFSRPKVFVKTDD
jgi:hypothetical protein